jgi:2-polyprenyl-3-methyl-5-hydroxy-6-metoxy-1,4-benzoquinol methylase
VQILEVRHMSTRFWKERLYDAYASSGQAAPRRVRDDAATADEILRPQAPHARQFIARYIPADRRARIMDLGCGDGMLLHFLGRAGYQNTFGVDLSSEQTARARRLGLHQVQQGEINRVLDDTADASVDVVLLMDVLEHLTRDDLFRTLDSVLRVLRSGGLCIAHVPNAEGLYGMRVRYGDFTHEQAFTAKSSAQVFRTIGFSEVSCREDAPVVHGPTSLTRRLLWAVGTLPHRLLLAAETGGTRFFLTQNLFIKATK